MPCAKHTYLLRKQTHDFELLTKSSTLEEEILYYLQALQGHLLISIILSIFFFVPVDNHF